MMPINGESHEFVGSQDGLVPEEAYHDSLECVWCGERKPIFEFEDGARCKSCVEEQDGDGNWMFIE